MTWSGKGQPPVHRPRLILHDPFDIDTHSDATDGAGGCGNLAEEAIGGDTCDVAMCPRGVVSPASRPYDDEV